MGRRFPIRRDTLRADGVAGLVLGAQSVPDCLATGLLAGVNPLAGLYAYMVGTFTGAQVTSSSFMPSKGTGAMAMIVADIPEVRTSADAERALVTLSICQPMVGIPKDLRDERLGAAITLTAELWSSRAEEIEHRHARTLAEDAFDRDLVAMLVEMLSAPAG